MVTSSRHAVKELLDQNFPHIDEGSSTDIHITDTDKDLVEYIAGFVVQRIRRQILRLKDCARKEQQTELITAVIRSEDEPTSSRLIIAKQRGGLLSVVTPLVPMFTKIEFIIRKYLTLGEVVSQSVVNKILSHVFNDDCLSNIFNSFINTLCLTVPEDVVNTLFHEIIVTYIRTRINGYCKKQIDRLKEQSRAHKKEKSLRTKLN